MGATETLLQVEGLTKSYDGSSKALEGVSFSMNRGEFVSLIGSSGAGKSTLLRCVNLLEQPTSGQVFFEDTEITAKGTDINAVRAKVDGYRERTPRPSWLQEFPHGRSQHLHGRGEACGFRCA